MSLKFYKFQAISSILISNGFNCWSLRDSRQNEAKPDFIARRNDGKTLNVKINTRLIFFREYENKNIYVAFIIEKEKLYLYPHDDILNALGKKGIISRTESWEKEGKYSFPKVPDKYKPLLKDHVYTLKK